MGSAPVTSLRGSRETAWQGELPAKPPRATHRLWHMPTQGGPRALPQPLCTPTPSLRVPFLEHSRQSTCIQGLCQTAGFPKDSGAGDGAGAGARPGQSFPARCGLTAHPR